jgi:diguanylate cyclase (GGDEF)-like protein
MLSEQEKLQICRRYELNCPICETKNVHFRLKPDAVRVTKTEGDTHPLKYKWNKPGFDSIDPKQFFWGTCQKCRFTGELDDAEFRQAERMIAEFRATLQGEALRQLLTDMAAGKGLAQSLGKRADDADPLVSALAKFHLGIYCQCLRLKLVPGNLARFYLRIAWLFRDQPTFYKDSNPAEAAAKLEKLKGRWEKELPANKEYPLVPGLALNEIEALRFSRAYFARNYETLKEAKLEDELRLRYLLAEIGFRLYELTNDADDYKKAASFFSGTMQKCLSIISDKSIVGGVVNRAKEMLETAGERGRELRELNKKRGGTGASYEEEPKEESAPERKEAKATPEPAPASSKAAEKPAPKAEKPSAKPANGQPADLDQAIRQITVLQEEVETLREKLKTAEEDNKKWRQLAGRDAATGLPNKTMLFRLVIPKTLKTLEKDGPFSCIAISLDQIAKVNEGHGWLMGDRMLKESVTALRKFLGQGEELYRLEGATFALVGAMDNNAARQRAAEMCRRLSRLSVQVEQSQLPLVSSLGVVTVERLTGKPVSEAANHIFEALLQTLYRAKEKGGNTFDICSSTRF